MYWSTQSYVWICLEKLMYCKSATLVKLSFPGFLYQRKKRKHRTVRLNMWLEFSNCRHWWRFELCFKKSTLLVILCIATQQLVPSGLYLYSICYYIYFWDFIEKWKGESSQKQIQTLKILQRKTHNLKDGWSERIPNFKGETGQSRTWGKPNAIPWIPLQIFFERNFHFVCVQVTLLWKPICIIWSISSF